jgi:hypothetical protein
MQNHKQEIEKIMNGMECPKDFECYKSGFKNIGKAKDTAVESFVVCLEDRAWQCEYSFSFGSSYLCKCPLRVYVLKKLGK